MLPKISESSSTVRFRDVKDLTLSSSGGLRKKSRSSPDLYLNRETRVSAFVDRQLSHPSIEARRKLALRQKSLIRDRRDEEDAKFWGKDGREGFRQYLITKFGSVLAGWRKLDIDKNGKLSYMEFCNGLRKLGYHGNLKRLWNELNVDSDDNFVTLMEIDPEVGQTVGMFKYKLMATYGDMLTAWQKGLDTNGTGRIEQPEVEACCKRLGLDLDTAKLWDMLRVAPSKGLGLRLEDFDPDAFNRWRSGDLKGHMSRGGLDLIEDLEGIRNEELELPQDMRQHYMAGGLKAFRKDITEEEVAAAKHAVHENTKIREPMNTAEGFRKAMVARFGSLMGAWRHALDVDGKDRLAFGEFCFILRRLGYSGFNLQGLWPQLDTEYRGYIVFGDLDPEVDSMWQELRSLFIRKYGNLLLAWLRGIDSKGIGYVDRARFVEACGAVGYSGDASRLFRLLQPDAGRHTLALYDFDPKAYRALSRGDFRMLSEAEEKDREGGGKHKLSMDLNERTEASFQVVLARARAHAQRSDLAKACNLADPPVKRQPGSEQFELLCTRKYGSLVGAWRLCLDKDGNGKLTFNEFCDALRKLGYVGDFKTLWKQYDVDRNGYISLHELDPEADVIIGDFLELLQTRYGDLRAVWKQGFKKDPTCHVDLAELKKLCQRNGYAHEVKPLFRCLQPIPGMRTFCIWDLHPLFLLRVRSTRRSVKPLVSPAAMAAAVFGGGASPSSPSGGPPQWPMSPASMMSPGSASLAGGLVASEADLLLEEAASPSKGGRVLKAGRSLLLLRIAPEELVVDTTEMLVSVRRGLEKVFGSTVAAWRLQLDSHDKGFATRGNFLIALEKIAFHGNVKALLQSLTGGEEKFTFADLDPDSQDRLNTLRSQLVERCGSIVGYWNESGAAEKGKISVEDFKATLTLVDVEVEDPAGLFQMFCVRLGQKLISSDDLKGVLIGVPAEQRSAVWGTELEPEEPSKREVISSRSKAHHEQDIRVTSFEGFKKLLKVQFGSLFAAWRLLLDADHNGLAKQVDFIEACKFLGLHNVKKLWAEADWREQGQLRLEDLDAELAQAFEEFETLLVNKYGHTKEAWRRTFGSEKTDGRVERFTFIDGCSELGYSGDASKLFDMLRPEVGRSALYYEDVWKNLNINDFELRSTAPEDFKSPLGSAKKRPLLSLSSFASPASSPTAGTAQRQHSLSLVSPKASSPSSAAAPQAKAAEPSPTGAATSVPAVQAASPTASAAVQKTPTPAPSVAAQPTPETTTETPAPTKADVLRGASPEAGPSERQVPQTTNLATPKAGAQATQEPAQDPAQTCVQAPAQAQAPAAATSAEQTRPVTPPVPPPPRTPPRAQTPTQLTATHSAPRAQTPPAAASTAQAPLAQRPQTPPAPPTPPQTATQRPRTPPASTPTHRPQTPPAPPTPPQTAAQRPRTPPASTPTQRPQTPPAPPTPPQTATQRPRTPPASISTHRPQTPPAPPTPPQTATQRPRTPPASTPTQRPQTPPAPPTPQTATQRPRTPPASTQTQRPQTPPVAPSPAAASRPQTPPASAAAAEPVPQSAAEQPSSSPSASLRPQTPQAPADATRPLTPPAGMETAAVESASKGTGEALKGAEGSQMRPEAPHSFEGQWSNLASEGQPICTVLGSMLTWANGEQQDVKIEGNVLTLRDCDTDALCDGQLQPSGEIRWSDGDEWRRPSAPSVIVAQTAPATSAAQKVQHDASQSDGAPDIQQASQDLANERAPDDEHGRTHTAQASKTTESVSEEEGKAEDVAAGDHEVQTRSSPDVASNKLADDLVAREVSGDASAKVPIQEATNAQVSQPERDIVASKEESAVSAQLQVVSADALYDFDPSTMEWPLEEPPLPLKEGQRVEIIDDIGDWVLGRLPDAPEVQGYFPRTYVTSFDLSDVLSSGIEKTLGTTTECTHVEALYDFDPSGMDWPLDEAPLPLKEGQRAQVILEEGDWILGRSLLDPAIEGYFPKSYVRNVHELDSSTHASAAPVAAHDSATSPAENTAARVVEAIYDFDPSGMDWPLDEAPLALKEGDRVEVIDDDGGDWILGRSVLTKAEGYFPRTYIEDIADAANGMSVTSQKPLNPVVLEALYEFDPSAMEWPLDDAEPLALKAGQKVEILTDDDSGWVLGRLVDRPESEGYFPKNYVG